MHRNQNVVMQPAGFELCNYASPPFISNFLFQILTWGSFRFVAKRREYFFSLFFLVRACCSALCVGVLL